jgi:glycosyltransferase involved in cell wall biosynthesis
VAAVPVVNYYQQPLIYDEAARSKVSGEMRTRLTAVRSLTWRASREASGHVVQTGWMREQVSAAWKIEAGSIVVATPAPPDWNDKGAARSNDLLWVGNHLGYKRWGQAQWIHSKFRDFASDSQLLATLPDAAGEGVEALGVVARESLRERYDTVGALLVTSMSESLGLPLLEAMAAGCPIVAPDLPWARSLCDNAALYYDSSKPLQAVERLRDAGEPKVLEDLRKRSVDRVEIIRSQDGWGKLVAMVCGSA